MKTNEMKQIADSATDGPWNIHRDGKNVIGGPHIVAHCEARYPACFADAKHIATFNPQRVNKMLLALEAVKTFKANAPEGFWECGFAEDVDNAIADLEALV